MAGSYRGCNFNPTDFAKQGSGLVEPAFGNGGVGAEQILVLSVATQNLVEARGDAGEGASTGPAIGIQGEVEEQASEPMDEESLTLDASSSDEEEEDDGTPATQSQTIREPTDDEILALAGSSSCSSDEEKDENEAPAAQTQTNGVSADDESSDSTGSSSSDEESDDDNAPATQTQTNSVSAPAALSGQSWICCSCFKRPMSVVDHATCLRCAHARCDSCEL